MVVEGGVSWVEPAIPVALARVDGGGPSPGGGSLRDMEGEAVKSRTWAWLLAKFQT